VELHTHIESQRLMYAQIGRRKILICRLMNGLLNCEVFWYLERAFHFLRTETSYEVRKINFNRRKMSTLLLFSTSFSFPTQMNKNTTLLFLFAILAFHFSLSFLMHLIAVFFCDFLDAVLA